MPALAIGLDLGTTRCKAVALDQAGRVVASASADYPLHTPRPGWAEQAAGDVWRGAMSALQGLLHSLEPGSEIAALGLSGAMHSLLLVDEAGAPLAPAMTWADQRAAPQAAALAAQTNPAELYRRTGCRLHALYHPAKLRWWFETAPETAARAARFVALRDWVFWRLTGEWLTDAGLASTTGLLQVDGIGQWHPPALALAGITADRLPALAYGPENHRPLTSSARSFTGLPAGLPVTPGASDGAAAMIGVEATRPYDTVITVGTSGAVRCIRPAPYADPEQRTWTYRLPFGFWLIGGAINNGGLALQWARERLYPELPNPDGYDRLLAEAALVVPGAEGVRVLPYFSGERSPHWDSQVRATFTGLGLEHTRGHLARAVLEGVSFCLADVWQVLRPIAAERYGDRGAELTGVIATHPLWAQIASDVLGLTLRASEAADASAVGAALLAFRALGQPVQLSQAVPPRVFTPDAERHARYRELHAEWQGLYRRLAG
jgi:gluconokinase